MGKDQFPLLDFWLDRRGCLLDGNDTANLEHVAKVHRDGQRQSDLESFGAIVRDREPFIEMVEYQRFPLQLQRLGSDLHELAAIILGRQRSIGKNDRGEMAGFGGGEQWNWRCFIQANLKTAEETGVHPIEPKPADIMQRDLAVRVVYQE